MSHFSHHCMHMATRAYANEMLLRLQVELTHQKLSQMHDFL